MAGANGAATVSSQFYQDSSGRWPGSAPLCPHSQLTDRNQTPALPPPGVPAVQSHQKMRNQKPLVGSSKDHRRDEERKVKIKAQGNRKAFREQGAFDGQCVSTAPVSGCKATAGLHSGFASTSMAEGGCSVGRPHWACSHPQTPFLWACRNPGQLRRTLPFPTNYPC